MGCLNDDTVVWMRDGIEHLWVRDGIEDQRRFGTRVMGWQEERGEG